MWLKLLVLSSISVVVPDLGELAKSLIESNHHTVAVFPEVLKVTDEGDYQFALATQQSREEMDRIHTRLEQRRRSKTGICRLDYSCRCVPRIQSERP